VTASLLEQLADLPKAKVDALIPAMAPGAATAFQYDWRYRARPEQLPPDGSWRVWLLMAGRGFGKTRCGAEWVRAEVKAGRRRIALVGPTAADARNVMVEGESGILAISPDPERPLYEPSKRRLSWPNGAIATTYSADEPERLRGPQHDAAWCDELGAWRYPEAWDMLMFGMRLGVDPRTVVTTTPRPAKLIRDLVRDPICVVTRGSRRSCLVTRHFGEDPANAGTGAYAAPGKRGRRSVSQEKEIYSRPMSPSAALHHQLCGKGGGNAVRRSGGAHVAACLALQSSSRQRAELPGPPRLPFGGQTQEFPFHRVDFGDIGCDVVIAAALPRHQAEAAAHEYLCRTRATQVNYRGQFLPSLAADPRGSALPENCRKISVQEHRGKLCGMARHDPRMEQIRVTAGLEDGMVENAIAFRLRQRGIGNLVHADSAQSRLVHRERIRGQAPLPIGPRSGIAGSAVRWSRWWSARNTSRRFLMKKGWRFSRAPALWSPSRVFASGTKSSNPVCSCGESGANRNWPGRRHGDRG
jgi:hypothetical protein